MTTDLLHRILAAADPADQVVPRRDPDAILADIVHIEPSPSASVAPRVRRRMLRVALVAAGAAAAIAVPVIRGDSAYAGWTAYPAALSTGQASAVAAQCQRWARVSTVLRLPRWCCPSVAVTSASPC